jgi:hypothetical protein
LAGDNHCNFVSKFVTSALKEIEVWENKRANVGDAALAEVSLKPSPTANRGRSATTVA